MELPVVFGLSLLVIGGSAAGEFSYDGKISRKVLENYLSRAITMNGLSWSETRDDDIRMLGNIGAKFIGRAAYLWGDPPADQVGFFRSVRDTVDRLRKADPDVLVQACVFEAIYSGVNNIPIPAWVLKEFGCDAQPRNFSYEAMLFDDGLHHNQWGPNGSVPDITKLETRMWFYYLSRSYIDAGCEAFHFGQIQLTGGRDAGYRCWADLLARVRKYASKHARRHMVVCDAHVGVKGAIPEVDGKFLLDFFSFPQRIKEVPGDGQKAILEAGYRDAIYGLSPGGITPSGWKCEHIPYLVEFDNCYPSGKEGQLDAGMPFVWGYEEIGWFAHQPEDCRNDYLRYADKWIREHDKNGHLQMPGSICLAVPVNGGHWYRANARGPACPQGFGQEQTIKEIWGRSHRPNAD